MYIMEYGGPVYDVEITTDSAYALDTSSSINYRIARITTESNDVTLEFYKENSDEIGKKVVGRRFEGQLNTLDPKVEESLWDE